MDEPNQEGSSSHCFNVWKQQIKLFPIAAPDQFQSPIHIALQDQINVIRYLFGGNWFSASCWRRRETNRQDASTREI